MNNIHNIDHHLHLQGLGFLARPETRVCRTCPSVSSTVGFSNFFLLVDKQLPKNSFGLSFFFIIILLIFSWKIDHCINITLSRTSNLTINLGFFTFKYGSLLQGFVSPTFTAVVITSEEKETIQHL